MDNEQLSQLQARLDALEAENAKLKAANTELSTQVDIWKPSARVEVAKPADRRSTADFVSPRNNVRQFKLSEAATMPEGDLLRAVENHLTEQIPSLSAASKKLIDNVVLFYPKGLVSALKGRHLDARKSGYRHYSHSLILEKYGFIPFVADEELKAAIL
jgi:hypothetical protein